MQNEKKLGMAALAVAALVIIALVAVLAFKSHKKKLDETAIVAAVGESTQLMRELLGGQAAGDAFARLEAHHKRIKAATRTPLADAAEDYVLGAREIARYRADAARLVPQAAAARQVLLAHLGGGGRRSDGKWYRQAAELKKRMENAHYGVSVALKTIDTLLEGMPASRQSLVPLLGESLLIRVDEIAAARQRVQEELKGAVAELERARQLPI